MNKADQQKRNRIVALSFVSVLLLLMYGPLAQLFVSADRVLYDQLAGGRPAKALSNAFIVSIDPKLKSNSEVLAEYGDVLEALQKSDVGRIVLSKPPEIPEADELPGWSALLVSGNPVFVPARHRFADISGKSGFVQISPDDDGVLRRSNLWHLYGGFMSPSLPLAIALDASATAPTVTPATVPAVSPPSP